MQLKPFLLDSPGKHWLLVEPKDRKKLAATLQELGFRVGHELPAQRSTSTGAGEELDQRAAGQREGQGPAPD